MDIAGYKIIESLHEGANSSVYRAERLSDHHKVIIKTDTNPSFGLQLGARLRFEYDLLSKLQISGVQRVILLDRNASGLLLISEDSGAIPLNKVLEDGLLDLIEILEIMRKLVRILKEVHQKNIIHKDINPSNILYHPETKEIYLIDFGSASILSRENADAQTLDYMEGTLAYISPEQTGRMNRPLDYRTDYYALGITFFQLATGDLPFHCQESLEWIHAHIAKQPPSPKEVRPGLPEAVARIILKLLEKDAENRYQSPNGLLYDLDICLHHLKKGSDIPFFELGEKDFSLKLQIPDRLFGRETEKKLIEDQYADIVEHGHMSVLSILGEAGTGKSMLVNEMQVVLSRDRGFFISGKYDQLQRNTPYLGIREALQDLIRDILVLKPDQMSAWKEKIKDTLGNNARVVANLIPELTYVTGPLPELIPLGPVETQNRFNRVFRSFIGLFARKEHPLVLFLDDIQWADASSTELIIDLLRNNTDSYLYLILASRPSDQVSFFQKQLLTHQKEGIPIQFIEMGSLKETDVRELLCETFKQDGPALDQLSGIITDKTKGNPFFINEFLNVLYRDGLVFFSQEKEKWEWDNDQIIREQITDNVVNLILDRVNNLQPDSLSVLQYASFLGHRFDLKELSVAMGKKPGLVNQLLLPSLKEGMVIPLTGSYKYSQDVLIDKDNDGSGEKFIYQFAHDRIQRAAFQSVPESEALQMHLHMGRLLRTSYMEDLSGNRLFDVLDHLNKASTLITQVEERRSLASLNFKAARRARDSAAYYPAQKYLEAGQKWLSEERWTTDYQLSLEFGKMEAELAFLNQDYQKALQIAETTLSKTKHLLDRTPLYITQIQTHVATAQLSEAIRVGRFFLKQLGVKIPLKPGKLNFLMELIRTKLSLRGRQIASLSKLSVLEDDHKKAAVQIIQNLIIPSYFTNPELWLILNFKSIRLYLDYGSSTQESFSYSVFSVVEGILGNYKRAEAFVELTFDSLEKWSDATQICPTYQVLGVGTYSFLQPYRKVQELLSRGIATGLETGELIFTGLSSLHLAALGFFSGEPLKSVAEEIIWQAELNIKLEQLHYHVLNIMLRSIEEMTNGNFADEIPELLNLSKEDSLQHVLETENIPNICTSYQMMAIGHFFKGDLGEAFQYIKKAEAYLENVAGVFYEKELLAYGMLIRLTLLEKRGKKLTGRTKRKILQKQKKLKKWSEFSPVNIKAKYELIEGYIKSLRGDSEALVHYERALEQAHEEGMLHWEALTHERMAYFHFANGKKEQARYHFSKTINLLQLWGTSNVIAVKEKEWTAIDKTYLSAKERGTLMKTTKSSLINSGSTRFSALEQLDLQTVIKATQTISSEIKLEKLLSALLDIILENAGAQYVALIIRHGEALHIDAEGWTDRVDNEIHHKLLVVGSGKVPESIVQYVSRTREDVVIHQLEDEARFGTDPYILQHKPKSILCSPILNQNRLVGVIYLDNKLAANVFTLQRLEILKILSTQIAISLENALLYENLEEKVRERTAKIERQKEEIEKAKEEAQAAEAKAKEANEAKSVFLSTISHELRTPLTSIIGFAKINNKRLEEKVFPQLEQQDPGTQKLISRIRQNNDVIISEGGRLTNLINELLDLAKIEAGKVDWRMEPSDMLEIIERATLATDSLFEQKPEILLVKDLPQQLPRITIDQNRFIQVIINLISNAVKFTDEGSVTISAEEKDRQVIVRVTDTGSGIPLEYQNKVFEKFKQVEDQQQGKPQGTGLGLPICKEIVEHHGGRIWLESEAGKGSVFSFSVPLEGRT